MDYKVGVIGIGNMGRPISENILKKIGSLTVYDIKEDTLKELKELGADVSFSPSEVAKKSNVILLIINDWRGVKEVLFGKNGITKEAEEGTIIIDMTTSDPFQSKEFYNRLLKRKIHYLDAPMTGGVLGARNAQLLLMVGGEKEVYERCIPIFELISKKAIYIGNCGSGHLIKLIHNLLSHATFLATCEAVTLGEKMGLSLETMINVFNQGNAMSYSTTVRFPKFILPKTFNMGASFNTVFKDISIVKKIAKRVGINLPINNCTYKYWKYMVDHGMGEEDWSKIYLKMREILKTKK
jgi:3-hydroxyisobutyrate dehydrogenase-like beta-hydroxyacid dehydrogenase